MVWNGMAWNRHGMEYFQLEGPYKGHLVYLPEHFRADQKWPGRGRREDAGAAVWWGEAGAAVPAARERVLLSLPGQAGPLSSQRSSARWSEKRCCACQPLPGHGGGTGPLFQAGTGGLQGGQGVPAAPSCWPQILCALGGVGGWWGPRAIPSGEGSHVPVPSLAATPASPPQQPVMSGCRGRSGGSPRGCGHPPPFS